MQLSVSIFQGNLRDPLRPDLLLVVHALVAFCTPDKSVAINTIVRRVRRGPLSDPFRMLDQYRNIA